MSLRLTIIVLCAAFSLGGAAYGATHTEVDTFIVVADGDLVAWLASGCATESDCIDEKPATTDDATTYLYTTFVNRQQYATVSFRWIAAQYTQVDSAKIYARMRWTSTGGGTSNCEIQFDTMGIDTDLDTFALSGDNAWHDYTTDNKITGLTTTNTETIEIGVRHYGTIGLSDEVQLSTLALIVYGTSDDNVWYCNDTLMISTGGVGTGNNSLWYDASAVGFLFAGSVSTVYLRSLIGVDTDSIRAHVLTKKIDSAFLYIYEDTLVGSPTDAGVFIVTIRGDTAGVYRANDNTSGVYRRSDKTWRRDDNSFTITDTLQWGAVGLDSNDVDAWKVRIATLNGDSVANGNFRHKVNVKTFIDSIKAYAGTMSNYASSDFPTGNSYNNGHGLFIRTVTEASSGNHYWSARGPYPMSQQAQHNEQMYIAIYTSPSGFNPRELIYKKKRGFGLRDEALRTFAGAVNDIQP